MFFWYRDIRFVPVREFELCKRGIFVDRGRKRAMGCEDSGDGYPGPPGTRGWVGVAGLPEERGRGGYPSGAERGDHPLRSGILRTASPSEFQGKRAGVQGRLAVAVAVVKQVAG